MLYKQTLKMLRVINFTGKNLCGVLSFKKRNSSLIYFFLNFLCSSDIFKTQ